MVKIEDALQKYSRKNWKKERNSQTYTVYYEEEKTEHVEIVAAMFA